MKYLNILLAGIVMMLATACRDKDEHGKEPETPMSSHTLLIYMAGDNSLSSICKDNIKLMKTGMINGGDDINLLIFKDNKDVGDRLPVLFQLKHTYDAKTGVSQIDTVLIEKYPKEINSCDPNIVAEVVNKAFSMFDTEVKGLELWSHGFSWVPDRSYQTRYIGVDNNDFLQLWDLRSALEQCPKLDYICFDACFMGMAEVAYELDKVCDYIVAPITEIIGKGYPYDIMMQILSSCKNKSQVEKTLADFVDQFGSRGFFDPYGFTVTMLQTSTAEALANSLAKLRNATQSRIEALQSQAIVYEASFLHYGRSTVDARYLFYDFFDYVDFLGADGTDDIKALVEETIQNQVVVCYSCTELFKVDSDIIDLRKCKGLGMSVPEFFGISRYTKDWMKQCYGKTKWGKALGY